MVGRRTLRWVVPAIVAAAAPALAGQVQAPSPAQVPLPAGAAPPPSAPSPAAPPQASQAQAGQPVPPPPGPVFVIYPSNPPSRATILLNTLTGETWLLGVNGPDGQYQWTRIAVGDPSETAAPPR